MTDPAEARTQIERSWIENADAWTEAVRSGRIASRRHGTDAAIVEAVVRWTPPGGRVLDVGCGEGWLARAVTAAGRAVVGTDASAPLIEQARALGGGEFRVLTYTELVADPGAAGGPYDTVVANFALLGDDADVVALLAALRDTLRPNGALLVQTVHPFTAAGDAPYRAGWQLETFSGFGGTFREPMPWYFRTVGAWLRVVRDAGLDVIECHEPVGPAGRPLSLLLTLQARRQ